jgi:predicted RNA-binding Zn-ribbon protein involved in translation (DUF1610 family)
MFLLIIIVGVIIGLVIGVPLAVIKYARSESVACPICGFESKLIDESSKCPKCKTRIVRTATGELITK